MDRIDKTILSTMQDGIPMLKEPFKEIAKKIGTNEDEIIARLKRLMKKSVIRRFGVSVNQRKAGIIANALVAWKVPQNRVDEVGKALSSYTEITHCYERQTVSGKWEYNIFIVVHASDRESVNKLTKKLSKAIGIKEYAVLFSVKQLKRASVTLPNHSHSRMEEPA